MIRLKHLKTFGEKSVDLAGYSFGAWVNVLALNRVNHVKRLIMVSPPIDFFNFSSIGHSPKIELVISGTMDEYADLEGIKKIINLWNPNASLKYIKGANHFYRGRTDEIISILHEFLNKK